MGGVKGTIGSQTITIYGKVVLLSLGRNQKITKIDTSQNSYLEVLNIYDNPIETLDVTQNPNLEILECQVSPNNTEKMGLKSLSFSADKNPKLKKLTISGKDMQTLDISNFPNLENGLIVSGKIKNLKINNNPKISSLGFTSSNEIESIDASNNLNLESLIIALTISNPDLKKVILLNTPKLNKFSIGCIPTDFKKSDLTFCVQVDANRVNNIPSGWADKFIELPRSGKRFINYQDSPCPYD